MKCSDNDIEVVFEDNHLLILNKPHGLATQSSLHHLDSLEERARKYLKKKTGKSSVYLHALHRLDKGVGGLVLFAKSSKALSRLQKQLKEKNITKIYRVTVEGSIHKPHGILTHYHKKGEFKAQIFDSDVSGSKKAQLKYKVIHINPTVLEIELITGRYHQIRAQLAHIGHPIYGDNKYGSSHSGSIQLQAIELIFEHPTLKNQVHIQL